MTNRFIAATGGIASGSGGVGAPWTLDWACNTANAGQAGDTFWMRGGVYVGKRGCAKSGASVIDGTARTDTTSGNVLTAAGVNLASVVVGTDYIAVTGGSGTGIILGEHFPITAVDNTAKTVTIAQNFTTSGAGTNVAWRIYRPIVFRSCEWSCPDGIPDYTRTYEWARLDGYQATTLVNSIGTNTCNLSPADNIILADGSFLGANTDMYIYDGTPNGQDEFVRILGQSGNTVNNCIRDVSINSPRGLKSHTAGATVVKIGSILDVTASYVIFRDMEIGDSWPIRAYPIIFIDHGDSIFIRNGADYTQYLNIVFAGNREGVFGSDGSKFYSLRGYIMYNIGDLDPVRGEGILWYLHGQSTDYRRISHGIAFNCATLAKAYGVTGGADQFFITHNTHFNTGALGPLGTVPGSNPMGYAPSHRFAAFQLSTDTQPPTNNVFEQNWAWHGPNTVPEGGGINFGFTSSGDIISVKDNYCVARGGSAIMFSHFNHATFSGNTWIQGQTATALDGTFTMCFQSGFFITEAANFSTNDVFYNRETLGATGSVEQSDIAGCKAGLYGTSGGNGACLDSNGSSNLLLLDKSTTGTQQDPGGSGACGPTNNYRFQNGCQNVSIGTGVKQWLSTGSINWTINTGYPTTNVSQVLPNLWESGRCVLRVVNWQKNASVPFNLSTCGLTHGDTYAIWDVQNFTPWSTATAIATGTYNSAAPTVSITTSGLTGVTPAIGTAGGAPLVLPPNTAQDSEAPLIVLIARKVGTGTVAQTNPGNGQRTFLALFGK